MKTATQSIISRKGLKVYLRALSIERQKMVKQIISETPPNEERWMKIKSYFMGISPSLVDNLFAWNIYKLSV